MIGGSVSGAHIKTSGFFLSMLSSVWRSKLAAKTLDGTRHRLEFEEEEADSFHKVVDLGSGLPVQVPDGLEGLLKLGRMASRHGLWTVLTAIEDELLRLLTIETCGEILTGAIIGGLERVEADSRKLALDDFQAFAGTTGYMDLDEDILISLLEDDDLKEAKEETVFETAVRWIQGDETGPRGDGILQKIRFPLMEGKYLLSEARDVLPESDRLQVLVLEALALQQVPLKKWRRSRTRFLEAKARQPRSLKNIAWSEYATDAEQRIPASVHAFSITICQNLVGCGLINGQIKLWGRETLGHDRTLAGHIQPVRALVSWDSFLISASDDTEIKVWDPASGRAESVLKGHTSAVLALAVSGDRLVSASRDQTLRVWKMGGAPVTWSCEHTLAGHTNDVLCLASFGGQAMSGSADRTIRVWVVGTGAFAMALEGHDGAVQALVATRGRRLLSASRDKTIRMWSLKTGACERTVAVFPPQSIQSIACMAIVGSRLVGGSASAPYSAAERYEVRVWEAETLALEHTFRQPVGQMVSSFSAEEGRLWACVGPELVLWGGDAADEPVESDTDTSISSSFFSPLQGGGE